MLPQTVSNAGFDDLVGSISYLVSNTFPSSIMQNHLWSSSRCLVSKLDKDLGKYLDKKAFCRR